MNGELPHLILDARYYALSPCIWAADPQGGEIWAMLRLDAIQRVVSRRKAC